MSEVIRTLSAEYASHRITSEFKKLIEGDDSQVDNFYDAARGRKFKFIAPRAVELLTVGLQQREEAFSRPESMVTASELAELLKEHGINIDRARVNELGQKYHGNSALFKAVKFKGAHRYYYHPDIIPFIKADITEAKKAKGPQEVFEVPTGMKALDIKTVGSVGVGPKALQEIVNGLSQEFPGQIVTEVKSGRYVFGTSAALVELKAELSMRELSKAKWTSWEYYRTNQKLPEYFAAIDEEVRSNVTHVRKIMRGGEEVLMVSSDLLDRVRKGVVRARTSGTADGIKHFRELNPRLVHS